MCFIATLPNNEVKLVAVNLYDLEPNLEQIAQPKPNQQPHPKIQLLQDEIVKMVKRAIWQNDEQVNR